MMKRNPTESSKTVAGLQLGWFTVWPYRPDLVMCYMWARKTFIAEHRNKSMVPFSEYAARYCVAEITMDMGWQKKLRDLGHFPEGPGHYTYIQYGDRHDSPLIFKSWKCKSWNEASVIGQARAQRKEVIQKRERDKLLARINLLGTARDHEKEIVPDDETE